MVVDVAHELLVPHPDGLSEQGLLVVPDEHEDDFVVHARGKDDVVPVALSRQSWRFREHLDSLTCAEKCFKGRGSRHKVVRS